MQRSAGNKVSPARFAGDGFVCVVNRNRDTYQVPLALAEAGLLRRFVTDFYAPAGFVSRLLPGFLRRRRVDGLPRDRTRSAWTSFVVQVVAHLFRRSGIGETTLGDALLAWTAGREARRLGAALYCYHSYIPRDIGRDRKLVVFAYHPTSWTEIALIEADARAFPEVAAPSARARSLLVQERAVDWSRADALVCASSFTAASLVESGCDPARIAVIPYGAPRSPERGFAPREEGAPARFLFVGQGVQRKGLHHLIRAWQAGPPDGASLTIVSYRIEPEIAALIADPSIRVLGHQPRDVLADLFRAADVFVMPSLIEGFGLVYGEALAHGCHVIGTRNTGLPDLDLDGEALTLVEAGDVAGLSRALAESAGRAGSGGYDRSRVAGQSARWTRADFRAAIAAHGASVLAGETDPQPATPKRPRGTHG